ncbi:hypothetical protein F3Y22_tig00110940pilonHSYRG00499 [Hibiscus syriacus]|uniref:TF-B3 domain-containing protein n=1 Tax=Hibiscus syriacus TaxID=106335 RepID=A0A6A2ZDA9_HIBSY|nr:hypothetical protein F3Y22_tig00110940pilonHSYRG00499 [Hibiscus syriacus]
MASNSNPNSQAFTSRTPHFFKVLLTDAIQHGKMKIPAKFVRKYGSGISSPVFLKVPSGTLWEVELTKSGSEVYLQKGWSDFVQHYSLDLEDFVVFRYGGHSLFNVIIFDKGASEIEYIHAENHTLSEQCQGTAVKQEKDDDDISVEIIDGTPTLPREKRRGPLPSPCPRLSKNPRINSRTNRTKSNGNFGNHTFNVSNRNGYSNCLTLGFSGRLSASSRKSNGGMSASPEHGGGSMRGTMRGKQKDKACQIASSFKSQNPFFTRVMQPSFLTDKYRMGLPIIFARKYLTEKKCKIQCVVDGKTWTMEYNNTSKRFVPRLCNGWKGFSIDNKLDVGDVCVFELISIVETTFNVFIFRREVAESVDFPNSLVDENGANPVKFKKSLGTDYGSKSKGAISFIDDDKAAVEEYQLPGDITILVVHTSQYTRGASSLDVVFKASSNYLPKDPDFKLVMRSCYLSHGGSRFPAAFAKG